MRASRYGIPPVYTSISMNVLQIDKWNSRLKILDYRRIDSKELDAIGRYAEGLGIGKVIAYVPESHADLLKAAGYESEGEIAGFLKGIDAGCFSLYIDPERAISNCLDEENRLITDCISSQPNPVQQLDQPYEIIGGTVGHAEEMASLFSDVFESYPSPVMDVTYLQYALRHDKNVYRLVVDDNRIVGIASAEIDGINLNAELTDCVTHPEYRGQGINRYLLDDLEREVRSQGIGTAYSLARANHAPINYAFHSQGFKYSGRLINNCQMCGSYEDMNIWVKRLK